MKKLLPFLFALMPLLATAVRVPYTCGEGNAFTIRIPVRIPASMSVEYEWYRNDTLIAGTKTGLTKNVAAIAYTIPDYKAYGDSVAFHFRYRVDCNDEWLLSPRYVVNFHTITCPTIVAPGAVSLTILSCSGGVSDAGVISRIGKRTCSDGVSDAGAISSLDVISCSGGVSDAGEISGITLK